MNNLRYWIWFVQCFGVGSYRIWEILSSYDNNPALCYDALKSGGVKNLSEKEEKLVARTSMKSAEEFLEYSSDKDYDIICYDDERYPERLKGIYNPPAVLFVMGDLSFIDDEVVITVVGTRKPSDYSIKFANRICDELAKVGTVLVSGFAMGIDSMAHRAALKNNGRTVAVLGCGIDVAYPQGNSELKKVIAVKGAVVTEFFPGTPPSGSNFPKRNRILSGLSLGTLVIEASSDSGALITADYAINQGREVFCVPPADLFDRRYSGVIRLIREGAIPVFSHLDVMFEYYENYSHKLFSANPYSSYCGEDTIIFEEAVKKEVKSKPQKTKKSAVLCEPAALPEEIDYSAYTSDEARILRLLEKGDSLLADEIAGLTGMEISDVLSVLTDLEISGAVRAMAGQRYMI